MEMTPSNSPVRQSGTALTNLIKQIGGFALAGLLGAIALLWLFAVLTEEVFDKEFSNFDNNFELGVHRLANPTLDFIFNFFTTIGGIAGIVILTVLTFGLLAVQKHFRSAWVLAIVVGGGVLINQVLKLLFHRPRPELWDIVSPRPNTFSFPSGHATASLCYFGCLIWLGWRFIQPQLWRTLWTILMVVAILLVGLSRVYFGVHYPTDVLAGWISGSFWLITVLSGVTIYENLHHSGQLERKNVS